jgi:predicted DNA-binding transcriptional regulator AlpA
VRPEDSDRVTVMSHGIGVTLEEIHSAYHMEALCAKFPPILGPERCAEMLGASINTLYFWLEHGHLRGAHRRRGKRQLLWRDRAILLFVNGNVCNDAASGLSRRAEFDVGLSNAEINAAFACQTPPQKFGPILGCEQLAHLLGLSRSTLYFWIQQDRFAGAVTKRGKRQVFWRNRAIALLFNGPEWEESNDQ